MTTISQEMERAAHDIMTMPSMRDNIEIGIAGAALAGLVGYLKTKDRHTATRYAMWGAGIGVGGQYLIFHMLKPAMKQFAASSSRAAAMMGGPRSYVGAPMYRGHQMPMHGAMHPHVQHQQQPPPCPPGMMYNPQFQQCVPFGG